MKHKRKTQRRSKAVLILVVGLLTLILILSCVVSQRKKNLSLTLNGQAEMTVEYGQEFQDPGATAARLSNGSQSEALAVKESGKVNTQKLGSYTITYKAGGLFGSVRVQRTVNVVDTTPPQIDLATIDGTYTLPGDSYFEEGYTATDNVDGDLTEKVTSYEENGKVYYSVTDSSGNEGTAVRKIRYHDPVGPNIVLEGEDEMTVEAGELFTDPGFSANDDTDGDLTSYVSIDGAVNVFAAGTYTLTYSVTDSDGNQTSATRTVTVNGDAVPTERVVYLTFDDGPGPYTQKLLDVLDKYNVKVTFFVTNQDPDYIDLISAEAEAGHTVAIHTYSHTYSKIYSSEEAYVADMNAMNDLIEQQTGQRTNLFRFPGGSSNTISKKYCSGIMSKLAQDLTTQGYYYFDWNITSGDAGETTDTQQIVQNVIAGMQERKVSVVLQHDVKEFSVDAVEDIIVWGLNNGFSFQPLTSTSPTAHQGINN